MATKDKPNNKNLRALFSVICLCIVALGLIVYFSTNSAHTTDVNEATTVVDKAKDKEKKITTQPSTALTTQENTQVQTTKKNENKKPTTVTSTEVSTMTSSDTNIPYKSFCGISDKNNRIIFRSNNQEHKNLIYVTGKDFINLKADKITWQELSYEQEYIEYVNNAKNQAMIAYGSISSRCKGENNSESAHKCYDDVEMC